MSLAGGRRCCRGVGSGCGTVVIVVVAGQAAEDALDQILDGVLPKPSPCLAVDVVPLLSPTCVASSPSLLFWSSGLSLKTFSSTRWRCFFGATCGTFNRSLAFDLGAALVLGQRELALIFTGESVDFQVLLFSSRSLQSGRIQARSRGQRAKDPLHQSLKHRDGAGRQRRQAGAVELDADPLEQRAVCVSRVLDKSGGEDGLPVRKSTPGISERRRQQRQEVGAVATVDHAVGDCSGRTDEVGASSSRPSESIMSWRAVPAAPVPLISGPKKTDGSERQEGRCRWLGNTQDWCYQGRGESDDRKCLP